MVKGHLRGREGASLGCVLTLLLASVGALAGEPVAIVEDIEAAGAKIQFMDYLGVGRVVELGASGRLEQGYLLSCQHETISGGRVTVGRQRSQVEGGRVERELVECDGGKLRLGSDTKGKSGVMVFRAPPKKSAAARNEPELTIYGASPMMVIGSGAASVSVERLEAVVDAVAEQPSLQDAEEKFDLVDPRRVDGRVMEVEPPAVALVEACPTLAGAIVVDVQVVPDDVDLLAGQQFGQRLHELDEVLRRAIGAYLPVDPAGVDVEGGDQLAGAVADVLVVATTVAAPGWLFDRVLATQGLHSGPGRYKLQISVTFSRNSGSGL